MEKNIDVKYTLKENIDLKTWIGCYEFFKLFSAPFNCVKWNFESSVPIGCPSEGW